MRRKRGQAGETLVETLVALLIVTLASLLFLQVTTASSQICEKTANADSGYEKALADVEEQSGSGTPGSIAVGGRSYVVRYYNSGGLTAYSAEKGSSG